LSGIEKVGAKKSLGFHCLSFRTADKCENSGAMSLFVHRIMNMRLDACVYLFIFWQEVKEHTLEGSRSIEEARLHPSHTPIPLSIASSALP
jgi:hypothetical protein